MRRVLKKCVAVALAAAMVVTLAPASADAAKKKPSLKKKETVEKGKTVTLKVKNGNKKAKVTWKSAKPKIAKITKQVKKGNKASAKVKGVKKGKSIITASYKLGKKTTKLKCTVTVKKASAKVDPTVAPTVAPTDAPTVAPTDAPTVAPTKGPTPTPTASPTPSPRPKNKNLDAWQVSTGSTFTIDGVKTAGEGWDDSNSNDLLTDITLESGVRNGDIPVTAANATLMWDGKDLYVLVEATGNSDKVIIYYDENAKATNDTATTVTIPFTGNATSSNDDYAVTASVNKKTGSYVVEAKITGKTDLVVSGTTSIDIQLNNGDVSVNYYDTRSAMLYDEEKNEFYLGDEQVKVGENAELMGPVTLLPMMPPSTAAFYTADGEAILAASGIASKEFEAPTEATDAAGVASNVKKIDLIPTTYWTDVYEANGAESIVFSKVNIPDWQGNAEKVALATKDENGNWVTNRDFAQAYIMWDEDYLYVMFDVNDSDISSQNETEVYTSDSTEFFLDEDGNCTTYDPEKDAIQFRVGAAANYFSCNIAGGGNYAEVGHTVGYKHEDGSVDDNIENATGYVTQYVIKLNDEHVANTYMGVDFQINDCFSYPVEEPGEYGLSGRAATLTAYDVTNTAYENPAVLERLKLVGIGAPVGEGSGDQGGNEGGNEEGGDDTGNEGGETAGNFVTLSAANEAINDPSNEVSYADGKATIKLNPAYSGFGVAWYFNDEHTDIDLTQYSKVVINYTAAEAYNMAITTKAGIQSNDYWNNGSTEANLQYVTFAAGTNTYELPLTATGQAVFIKWNTYGANPEPTEKCDIVINSIELK